VADADEIDKCVEELIHASQTYDRAVDVVSAFEMLYTTSKTLPATVRHFERFPRLTHPDGNPCTPDFTVVFHDGGGLAGEVARIAQNEESVDGVCKQLLRYDALEELPVTPEGVVEKVKYADVVLLAPLTVGAPTVKRILHDRLGDPEHWYSPTAVPCILQFGFDEGKLIIQRPQDPANGDLREEERMDGISSWFAGGGQINVPPEMFAPIKAAKAFINDGVDDLYLATHLWAKTFPTIESAREDGLGALLSTTVAELAGDLRTRFGYIRQADVLRAMKLLQTARLAEATKDAKWLVAWNRLPTRGERELQLNLAGRVCDPPKTSTIPRRRAAAAKKAKPKEGQQGLFGTV
jgi:hypothetical protein